MNIEAYKQRLTDRMLSLRAQEDCACERADYVAALRYSILYSYVDRRSLELEKESKN